MNIYIDESGSINNKLTPNNDFVISLLCVKDKNKLNRAYKRFVGSNVDTLRKLDVDKIDPVDGRILRQGGKMFSNGRFKELKGNQFDPETKRKFVDYFMKGAYFDLFYIRLYNHRLTDVFCSNTSRGFNFLIKNSLEYYLRKGMIPCEDLLLQLDERNERTGTRHFLEEYLNTELITPSDIHFDIQVAYFDSSDNKFIQIADVFANLFYSHLMSGAYQEEINKMRQAGVLKHIYEFPLVR